MIFFLLTATYIDTYNRLYKLQYNIAGSHNTKHKKKAFNYIKSTSFEGTVIVAHNRK